MGNISDNNKKVCHTNRVDGIVEICHNHHNGIKNIDITSKPLSDSDLTALFRYCDNPRLFVKTLRDVAPESTAQQDDAELQFHAKLYQRIKKVVKRSML